MLTDIDQARVDKGVGYVHAEIDKLLGKGRISPDQANRLKALVTGSLTKDGFADADFVIEAVFEELGVKQQVFAEVEAVVSAAVHARHQHLLAVGHRDGRRTWSTPSGSWASTSSTRSRSCRCWRSSAATRTDDADAGHGVRHRQDAEEDLRPGEGRPRVRRQPAARPAHQRGVDGVVDEGTPLEVADRAFGGLGLPMPPFVLLGLVGPAIALHITETLHAAFPDRFSVSENLRRVVEAGKRGVLRLARGQAGASTPRSRRCCRSPAEPVVLDEAQVRERVAVRPGAGGAADARRGRRRRPAGHRPGDDHRRRASRSGTAASPRCWTVSACPRRSPAGGSSRSVSPACRPDRPAAAAGAPPARSAHGGAPAVRWAVRHQRVGLALSHM